jgi:hypothetical protein
MARATLRLSSGKPPCQRSTVNAKHKTAGKRPPFKSSLSGIALCPTVRSRLGTALVVAVAAVHWLSTDGSERNLGGDTAAIAGDAHHLPLTPATISIAGHFSFITAVLASFRLVREASLSIEGLFVLAEHELPSAVGTIEGFVVESVHEPLIS